DLFLFEDVDRGDSGGAGHGVAGVGQPPGVGFVIKRLGDGTRNDDAAERDVAGVDAFGEADQIRGDAPVVDGEPFAAATETGHDFVDDEDDAVGVTNGAHAGEVAVRGHQNAIGADDGFQNDGGNGVRAFHHDRVAQMLQRAFAFFLFTGGVEGRAVGIGAPEMHDAGYGGFGAPAARVAGQRNRAGGGAVVAAVGGQYFLPTGVVAGHAHGVFVGFGAAVGEKHLVESIRGDRADQACGFGAHVVGKWRRDVGQAFGLGLDGGDQLRMLVTEVEIDQLRGKIQIAVAGIV